MLNSFTFNGVNSRDFGVYISGNGRITVPQKAYNYLDIPGRHGDAIVNRAARVSNDLIVYPAFIAPTNDSGIIRSYTEMVSRLRAWLLSVKGYAVLRDTYEPQIYRLASFAGPVEFNSLPNLRAGTFEIPFNAKPQRYHDDDEDIYTLSAGEEITVDKCGYLSSEPLISVTGTGSFTIGGKTVTVSQNNLTAPIKIDSRRMDCYDSTGANANRYVSFSDFQFPVLEDGTVINSGSVALVVKPRWFEL